MKKLIFGAILAAAAFASPLQAADETGAFYVSPLATYTFLDHDRAASDHVGFQAGLGFNFAPNWAGELNGAYTRFGGPGSTRLSLTEYSADVLYKFLPDSLIRPYVLVGIGGIDDNPSGLPRRSSFATEAGLGLLVGIGNQTGPVRVAVRGEGKWRKTVGDPEPGVTNPADTVVALGLQVSFGGRKPPPTVMPPPLPKDSDGDGVTDDRDQCPNTPAGARVDANGCEFDSDGDGVVDRLDQCPNTPKGTPVNEVGCPLDSDGDGVIDRDDRCPNTPKGDRVDNHGCTIKGEIVLERVHFNIDSAELMPDSAEVLDDAVSTLKKYPQLVIEVRGHTDNTGTAKHNLILSQHRAETVMRYLKDHGVTNTLTAKGYGLTMPVADNKTTEGRALNRRVTLKILSGE